MITELVIQLLRTTRKFITGRKCQSCEGLGQRWKDGGLHECQKCKGQGRLFPWEMKRWKP
jgi:DnaJ-class molecular chaperone